MYFDFFLLLLALLMPFTFVRGFFLCSKCLFIVAKNKFYLGAKK